jgi:hypothetical protein
MRTAPSSYLIQKTRLKQRALTLRIPQHVHDALNATRERADKAGFVFDIQAVVVEALERAVTKVDGELGVQQPDDPVAVKLEEQLRKRCPARVVEDLKQVN